MKKLSVLLVVIFVLLFSCAGLNLNKSDSREVKFGPVSYTMPLAVPDFSEWTGTPAPILMSQRLDVVRWFASNPNNSDENVLMLVALENHDQPYMIGVAHTPSVKLGKRNFYADKQYVLTGKPSFVLSFVDEPPNVAKFIVMKQLQLTPKMEI
jgi:hypothetical protein